MTEPRFILPRLNPAGRDSTIRGMRIRDYQPPWLNGRELITNVHGQRLAGLVGHILNHVWLVWDLDADEWFTDAPVLLDFGIDQLEVDHQKFDDLSITWNTAVTKSDVARLRP